MENILLKKGFTLIELIIVIAIIGLIAAIAVPAFLNVQEDTKISADRASVKVIMDALDHYYAENESYPVTGIGVASNLISSGGDLRDYLKNTPRYKDGTEILSSSPSSYTTSGTGFSLTINADPELTNITFNTSINESTNVNDLIKK